jgi:hypothetical protein
MRKIRNPRQTRLFDPFDPVLTARTRQALLADWPGVFRHVLLELMPVEELGAGFDPTEGRPTKERYSMAGLLVVKEFMNWTAAEALAAYRFRLDLHYALNLPPRAQDLSVRTLERYARLFVDHDLASQVMHQVTTTLVRECGLRIDQQRLDSTHVYSNMASFGRTRLMGVAVKRFLTQVKRHDGAAYEALDEALRQRYAPSAQRLFGGLANDEPRRRVLRQQVAEDLHQLIRRFGDDPQHQPRQTYQLLVQVFFEQCEVVEEQVTLKTRTGGAVIQNTSDPEATYDGHKGQGYQVQLAETCHADNPVQLITAAVPQTAVAADSAALPLVLDELATQQVLPATLLADTLYGSDENVQAAASGGVELVSPTQDGAHAAAAPTVAGSTDQTEVARDQADGMTVAMDGEVTLADFVLVGATETVTQCPKGQTPASSRPDRSTGKTTTTMPAAACAACPSFGHCPVRLVRGIYRVVHTAKQRRLAVRRRQEQTAAFQDRYRRRAGIESTNSGVKRRTGLGQLRVRGRPRVFTAILLRLVGWNILRAAACPAIRKTVAERAQIAAQGGLFAPLAAVWRQLARLIVRRRLRWPWLAHCQLQPGLLPLPERRPPAA